MREDPLGLGEGVARVRVGVGDDLVLGHPGQLETVQGDLERQDRVLAAVDGRPRPGLRRAVETAEVVTGNGKGRAPVTGTRPSVC